MGFIKRIIRNTMYYKEVQEVLSVATISLRVDERDSKLIRDYAKLKKTSVSDLMRNTIIEKIEDEIDLENFDRVLASMEKTHSLDDVKKELGL